MGLFDRIGNLVRGGPAPLPDRAPQDLQIGDMVEIDSETAELDWLKNSEFGVEERVVYRGEGGGIWWAFLLVSPEDKAWLSVVDDEGVELALYRPVQYRPEFPLPDRITLEGKEFTLTQQGFARGQVQRRSGHLSEEERLEYWSLEGPEGVSLAIERWGLTDDRDVPAGVGSVSVTVGTPLKSYQVKIYPAAPGS